MFLTLTISCKFLDKEIPDLNTRHIPIRICEITLTNINASYLVPDSEYKQIKSIPLCTLLVKPRFDIFFTTHICQKGR